MAQTVSDWYGQNDSPELIVKRAKAITAHLPFLKASKAQMVNDHSSGFDIYQRRTQNGKIETKSVRKNRGRVQSISYDVDDGKYFINVENGIPIKNEFDSDEVIEAQTAAELVNPYDYQRLKTDFSGTNQCIVVRSKMSPEMIAAIAKKFIRAFPDFDPKYIRCINDYYIREADGIVMGYIQRNASGAIMGDRLADVIVVSDPIPSSEFLVPMSGKAIKADSLNKAVDISTTNIVKGGAHDQNVHRNLFVIRITLSVLAAVPIVWLLRKIKFGGAH